MAPLLRSISDYSRRVRHASFHPALLLNPFYVFAKAGSIRSWNDFTWRLDDLIVHLRGLWRTALRGGDRRRADELAGRCLRQETVRRWAVGRGLDIGCGARPMLPGRAETLDYDPRWRLQVDYFAPCDRIPVEDGRYDFAAASHVLEHLRNPVAALEEWRRILRPGGILILIMPDCRLYVPDRKRLESGERRVDGSRLDEAYGRGEANSPPLEEQENGPARSWNRRYCRHHFLWRLEDARRLVERLGFEAVYGAESSDAFAAAFSASLWPRCARPRFIELSDAEPLAAELLELQERLGAPALDYSFILVAKRR